MTSRLGEWSWPDISALPRPPLLVIPVGACEQHGPHLPLDTDTRIAVALAESLAERRASGEVVVAPPLGVSSSGEHRHFPGTLSIGAPATEMVLVEMCRSADWADGVVLVNGHGGNRRPVERATATLMAEGRPVMAWWPRVDGGDAHAGRTETSMMLALDPQAVRLDAAEAGTTAPLAALAETLRTLGVHAASANGVLGDPTGADAAEGRQLLRTLADDLDAAVRGWWR